MRTIQVANLSGKMIEGARWRVKDLLNVSVGEVVRVNLRVDDEKLVKYLAKNPAQECTMEEEEQGHSVTVGFIVDRFTHFLDGESEEKELESMAWLKPMNRPVELITTFLLDRENCEHKFLAAVGVKRKEGKEEA